MTSAPHHNAHTHREIGSGTGLVGLCIASAKSGFEPHEVVITDQADHLPLIRRNARANGLLPPLPFAAEEEGGGKKEDDGDGDGNPPELPSGGGDGGHGRRRQQQQQRQQRRVRVQEFDWVSGAGVGDLGVDSRPFDVVVGTDVAYCPELYAPVVKVRCSGWW
jgi:hypothetical protein